MCKTFLAFLLLVYGIKAQMAPTYQKNNEEKYSLDKTEAPKEAQKEPEKTTGYQPEKPAGYQPVPGDAYALECKYEDVPFTDCDPFHLVKWRQMKLLLGGSHCESYKNETERCSSEDFPPGK